MVEVRRLAAGRPLRVATRSSSSGRRSCFTGESNNAQQVFAQRVRIDFLKLPAYVVDQPGKFLVGNQREDGESCAHLPGVEVNRADGPRSGQHLEDRRADRRSARIA